MSISAMARLVAERRQQEAMAQTLVLERGSERTAADAEAGKKASLTALEKLTAFIPAEIVAGWAAAMGLLLPREPWQRWLIFVASVAVLVILVLLELAARDKQALEKHRAGGTDQSVPLTPGRTKGLVVLSAVIAFTVWAFAVPGSPAVVWGESASRIFAVLAIPVSAILYKAGKLWGLVPID